MELYIAICVIGLIVAIVCNYVKYTRVRYYGKIIGALIFLVGFILLIGTEILAVF